MSGEASAPAPPAHPGCDCEFWSLFRGRPAAPDRWANTRGALKGGLIDLSACLTVAFLVDAALDIRRRIA